MAKLCSSYGSSPNFSFLQDDIYAGDLAQVQPELGLSSSDLGLIYPDPAELFEDVNLLNYWPTNSICGDIQKIKADSPPSLCGSFIDNCGLTDVKSEIRNMDCMWSASTSLLSTSASSSLSDGVNGETAVPLSAITGSNTQNINNNNNSNNNNNNISTNKSGNNNNHHHQSTRLTVSAPTVVVANNHKLQQQQNINSIKLCSSSKNSSSNNSGSSSSSSSSSNSCSGSGSNNNNQEQQFATVFVQHRDIKEEPFDDYEQQLQQHSIPTTTIITKQQQNKKQLINSSNATTQSTTTNATTTTTNNNSMQHIPPGTSLLRKQQQQPQRKLKQQQQTASIQIPKIYAGEFVRERDQLLTSANNKYNYTNSSRNNKIISNNSSSNYMRPDTPHSLDDDNNNNNNNKNVEFFKHNIDLHACVMGSNNISLTGDPTNFIHHVSQELQDTTKTQIDMRYVAAGCCSSLAEVAEVLEGIDSSECSGGDNGGLGCGTTASSSGIDCDTDSGEDEEWHDRQPSSCSMDSMLDAAADDDLISNYVMANAASPVPSQDSLMSGSSASSHHNYSNSSTQQPPYIMHSDHSYTRCKDGMDDLGPSLETPSDSGELKFSLIFFLNLSKSVKFPTLWQLT